MSSKTYTSPDGKHSVTVADDGAIRVRQGDMISKYSAAIYGTLTSNWDKFGRRQGNAVQPLNDPNKIVAGETLYHIPTFKAKGGAPAPGTAPKAHPQAGPGQPSSHDLTAPGGEMKDLLPNGEVAVEVPLPGRLVSPWFIGKAKLTVKLKLDNGSKTTIAVNVSKLKATVKREFEVRWNDKAVKGVTLEVEKQIRKKIKSPQELLEHKFQVKFNLKELGADVFVDEVKLGYELKAEELSTEAAPGEAAPTGPGGWAKKVPLPLFVTFAWHQKSFHLGQGLNVDLPHGVKAVVELTINYFPGVAFWEKAIQYGRKFVQQLVRMMRAGVSWARSFLMWLLRAFSLPVVWIPIGAAVGTFVAFAGMAKFVDSAQKKGEKLALASALAIVYTHTLLTLNGEPDRLGKYIMGTSLFRQGERDARDMEGKYGKLYGQTRKNAIQDARALAASMFPHDKPPEASALKWYRDYMVHKALKAIGKEQHKPLAEGDLYDGYRSLIQVVTKELEAKL